jgi:hypothetical protein
MGLLRRVKNLYKLKDNKLRGENLFKAVVLPGYPTTTAWQVNQMNRELSLKLTLEDGSMSRWVW